VPVVSPVTVSGDSVGCPSSPGIVVGALEGIRPTPPTTTAIAQAMPTAPRPPSGPSEVAATEQRLRIHGRGRHLVGDAREQVSDVRVVQVITSGVVRSASRPRATSERTVTWRQPRSSAIVASGRSSK
jgi:hypothetical protein